MEGTLLGLLAPRRERAVTLGGRGFTLRVISAADAVAARCEAEELAEDGDVVMTENSCVLARALCSGEARLFGTGRELLSALTAREIEYLAEGYAELARAQPGEREVARLVEELDAERYERLKWRVLKAFGVLPSEKRAGEMTDADYLLAAMHLRLDDEDALRGLCPDCRARAESGLCHACGEPRELPSNPEFDLEEYLRLKGGSPDG